MHAGQVSPAAASIPVSGAISGTRSRLTGIADRSGLLSSEAPAKTQYRCAASATCGMCAIFRSAIPGSVRHVTVLTLAGGVAVASQSPSVPSVPTTTAGRLSQAVPVLKAPAIERAEPCRIRSSPDSHPTSCRCWDWSGRLGSVGERRAIAASDVSMAICHHYRSEVKRKDGYLPSKISATHRHRPKLCRLSHLQLRRWFLGPLRAVGGAGRAWIVRIGWRMVVER